MLSNYNTLGNQEHASATLISEDPELVRFREEIRRKKMQEVSVKSGRTSPVLKPKAEPLIGQTRLYVRIFGVTFSIVSFMAASLAADLPAGAFFWYDFLVVTTVLAMVLDLIFITTYFTEREGLEWCFDPLRDYMPRAEFFMTLAWTIMLFSGAIASAVNLPELQDVLADPELKLPRVACAFDFFTSFMWMTSTWLSYRRWRSNSTEGVVRYSAINSDSL